MFVLFFKIYLFSVSCCNPYHYALWIRPETNGGDDDGSEDKNSSVPQNNHRSSLIGNGHITYRHRDREFLFKY